MDTEHTEAAEAEAPVVENAEPKVTFESIAVETLTALMATGNDAHTSDIVARARARVVAAGLDG